MGRTVTCTYRLEVWEGRNKPVTPMCWNSKGWGRPTKANLAKWVSKYIKSLQKGGANYHVSRSLGYIPVPTKAKIIRQKTGEVVATWLAPKFMVI